MALVFPLGLGEAGLAVKFLELLQVHPAEAACHPAYEVQDLRVLSLPLPRVEEAAAVVVHQVREPAGGG